MYLFNQVKRSMPLHARKLYLTGMAQPIIDYGCVVWASCGQYMFYNFFFCNDTFDVGIYLFIILFIYCFDVYILFSLYNCVCKSLCD